MMKKQKTIKSIAKRFKVTKKGKVIKRTCGQDHFNRKEPGKVTRMKRGDRTLTKSHAKVVKHILK